MAVDFDDSVLDGSFAIFGISATYTPDGGEASSITVIRSQEDEISNFGDTRIQSENRGLFEVRKSELAVPAKGGIVTVDGVDFTVKSFRTLDEEKLLWLLDCYTS